MEFSIAVAFFAGLVSFLSPCVFPLIPAFLAYLAGVSFAEVSQKRKIVFLSSVFFVLGFSLIFSVVGVLLNTILEAIGYDVQYWLAKIGGGIIILFGIYLLGILEIPFLEREYKFVAQKKFNSPYLTSFVFGSAFAAGWTPCVGVVLGGILGLAATAPGSAFSLLFSYSVGLGLPFLLVGTFAAKADVFLNRYAFILGYARKVFGVVLMVLGVLSFTQNLSRFANLETVLQLFK